MTEPSAWTRMTQEDPGHSTAYVQRFRDLAAVGRDLAGEARLVDAMLSRKSRGLEARCGPGRVGAFLHGAGHSVVGGDVDPVLIAAAEEDHPGPRPPPPPRAPPPRAPGAWPPPGRSCPRPPPEPRSRSTRSCARAT